MISRSAGAPLRENVIVDFGGQTMDQDPRASVAGAAKWFSCISIIFMDFHWLFLQLRKQPNSLSIAVNQKWKLSAFSDIRPKRVCFQQNTQFLALSLSHTHALTVLQENCWTLRINLVAKATNIKTANASNMQTLLYLKGEQHEPNECHHNLNCRCVSVGRVTK